MLLTDETEVCGFRNPKLLEETLLWPPQPLPSHYSCIHSVNIYFVPTVYQALSWVLGPLETLSVWFAAVFSPRALYL